MSITRGIRSMSYGYVRDFVNVPETEENICNEILIETDEDETCCVKIVNVWPDFIRLKASINPVGFFEDVVCERVENGKVMEKTGCYFFPRIDSGSSIKNPNFLHSKIVINYENLGEYCFDKNIEKFQSKLFDDYELNFKNGNSILFEKNFLLSTGGIISEKYSSRIGEPLQLEALERGIASRLHPYGGFYSFGDHPACIESCIFHLATEQKKTTLKISTLSSMKNAGLDPTRNNTLKDGRTVIGVTDFSPSQKLNLYEELKLGACGINVTNRNTSEVCSYRSMGVEHIDNTNIILINFIKE